jgi:hypothetical protein
MSISVQKPDFAPAPGSPVAAARRLAELVPVLPALGDNGAWLAGVLVRYLDPHSSHRLEELLGLAVRGKGGESWHAHLRRAERDDALRRIAAAFTGTMLQRAKDVAREVRRYEVRWQRDDRHRPMMPAEYAGSMRADLYAAFASREPIPASLSQLRNVLSASSDEIIVADRFWISSATAPGMLEIDSTLEHVAMQSTVARTPNTAAVVGVLADLAPVRQALAERDAQRVMSRNALLAELRALERTAEHAYPGQVAAIEKAAEAVRAAEKLLAAARDKHAKAVHARQNASFGYDRERQRIEGELLASADVEVLNAIAAFRDEMLDDQTRTRKLCEVHQEVTRNPITGRRRESSMSNAKSISARLRATLDAIPAAEEMRFQADMSTVPAKLAELRAGLPPVEMTTVEPEVA